MKQLRFSALLMLAVSMGCGGDDSGGAKGDASDGGAADLASGLGKASLSQSVLAISEATLAPGATATLTLVVKDSAGNHVDGLTATDVAFAIGQSGTSSGTIGQVSAVSGSTGVFHATFTATTSGTANTVVASLTAGGTFSSTAAFTVSAGVLSDTHSTVAASPSTVLADGSATSTITVTLQDAFGNGIAGDTIALASSRGASDLITPASSAADANGVATFTVSSVIAGSAILTATDTTSTDTLDQTATVTFTPLQIDVGQSTLSATPSSVAYDGWSTAKVTATLKDSGGNPLAGRTVNLLSDRLADIITPASGVSDATGKVVFRVSSVNHGTSNYSAKDVLTGALLTAKVQVSFVAPLRTDGLILQYGFNSNEGATVSDLSGYGNTGTTHGATYTASGQTGGGYQFTALSMSSLTAARSDGLDSMQITRGLTIAAWINVASIGATYPVLVSKYGASDGGYELLLDSGSSALVWNGSGGCQFTTHNSNGAWVNSHLSTWIHVAFTVDSSNNGRFYVNGLDTQDSSAGSTNCANLKFDSASDLYIGEPSPTASADHTYYDGLMDDVRIYTRALGADEIKAIHDPSFMPLELPDSASAGGWVNMTGNIALFHLNESAGATTFSDTSGQGHNGTCTTCPTAGSSGLINKGIAGGGAARVALGTLTGFSSVATDQTKMFWINPSTVLSTGNYYIWDEGGNNNWVQLYDVDGDGKLEIRAGSNAGSYLNGHFHFTRANTWYHVAVTTGTVSGTTTTAIYVNGVLDVSGTVSATNPGTIIFGNSFSSSQPFIGVMDEVALFNRALSATDILKIYQDQ